MNSRTHHKLLPLEWLVIGYTLLTTLFIFFWYERMDHPDEMLLGRAGVLALVFVLWRLYRLWPNRLMFLVRNAAHGGLLAWWYPDTYEFNRLFDNLDPLFAKADQWLFGFQPALRFSEAFPSVWFSEAFNLGYYSYYYMMAVVALFYFLKRYWDFERMMFMLIASFFLYYLVYMFLPVAGPQFYYQAVGVDTIAAGNFPWLGDYFNTHTEMLPAPGDANGLFYKLVTSAQAAGERPTAAFPSSHIGVSTLLVLLAWRANRRLAFVIAPFYVLLCGATVYIQAHYFVDGVAGVLTGIGVYVFTLWLSRWFIPTNEGVSPETNT